MNTPKLSLATAAKEATARIVLLFLMLVAYFAPVARLHGAADFYTVVTVAVTNQIAPGIKTNGADTITVNGDTRTGTNIIASNPAKFFFGTNSQAKATTNLYNHLALYPFGSAATRLSIVWVNTNTFQLIGQINQAVAASAGGVWGTVNLTNYTTTNRTGVVWPAAAVSALTQINTGNALADYLNVAITRILPGIAAFAHITDNTSAQTVSNKTLTGPVITGGRWTGLTNASGTNVQFTNVTGAFFDLHTGTISGVSSFQGTNVGIVNVGVTNGYEVAVTNINPVFSNAVNYGNAIRSEGPGGNSLQVGSNAVAAGLRSVAVGNSSVASNADTIAIGTSSIATNQYALALGNFAGAYGIDSLAIGRGAVATTNYTLALGQGSVAGANGAVALGQGSIANDIGAITLGVGGVVNPGCYQGMALGYGAFTQLGIQGMAIGPFALSQFSNSLALGPPNNAGTAVSTTTTNQIRLGTTTHSVSVPGFLDAAVIRNGAQLGTNTIDGILAFSNPLTVASVTTGHNVIDSKTNTILYLTGAPGSAWTLGGFTGAKNDGRHLIAINQTGFDVTIFNESGTAPTASDRIFTYASAGGVTNVILTGNGVMEFSYSTAASRWILRSPSVDVTASATNAPAFLNGSMTNANFYQTGSSVALTVNPLIGSAADTSATLSTNGTVIAGVNSNGTTFARGLTGSTANIWEVQRTNGTPTHFVRSNNAVVSSNLLITPFGTELGVPYRLVLLTNDVTVTNTTAETSMIAGAGLGTYTFPANFFTPGLTLKVDLFGKMNTAAVPGVHTLAIKLGTTVICTNVTTFPASLASDMWHLTATLTCRLTGASGSLKGQGVFFNVTAAGGVGAQARSLKWNPTHDAVTLDTTASQVFDITLTPGATTTGLTTTEGCVLIIP